MPAVNAVIELENMPVPVLSAVLVLNAVVGPVVVLQHTPRAVTVAPPALVIFPPLVAAACVIADAAVVVIIGGVGLSFLHECVKEIERINRITPEILNKFFMLIMLRLTFVIKVPNKFTVCFL